MANGCSLASSLSFSFSVLYFVPFRSFFPSLSYIILLLPYGYASRSASEPYLARPLLPALPPRSAFSSCSRCSISNRQCLCKPDGCQRTSQYPHCCRISRGCVCDSLVRCVPCLTPFLQKLTDCLFRYADMENQSLETAQVHPDSRIREDNLDLKREKRLLQWR